jgi:hypothetical protein
MENKMESLKSVTVTIQVDTNKQSHTEVLHLGDAEARDAFALRVAQAVRETPGEDHEDLKQPIILVVLCSCGNTTPESFDSAIGGTYDYSYGM